MDKTFFESSKFKWILSIIGGIIVILLSFQLGKFVGFHKATSSYRWGENYHNMFGGPRGGFMGGFMNDFDGDDFINNHGVAGQIVKIDGNAVIIKSQDAVEKTISIEKDTVIRKGRSDLKVTDLKVNDRIVIVGEPKDDGSIAAKVIRVFDSTDMMTFKRR